MDITGTIHKIFPEETITENFTKREFVLKTGGEYSQEILMQVVNKKLTLINDAMLNEEVKVFFNLRGRPNRDGRYFNQVEAWKIEKP